MRYGSICCSGSTSRQKHRSSERQRISSAIFAALFEKLISHATHQRRYFMISNVTRSLYLRTAFPSPLTLGQWNRNVQYRTYVSR